MNTSEQKALGRTRRLLAAAFIALLLAAILVIFGWRERRDLKEAAEETRQIQSRQQAAMLEKETILRFLSGQLDAIQQQIECGTQESREALDLFSAQLLPAGEQKLAAEIDTLRREVQALDARRRKEAGEREVRELQSRKQPDYAEQNAKTRAEQELSKSLLEFWEKGAELASLEAQRQLITFRKEQLKTLERGHRDDPEAESLLRAVTTELYHALLVLDRFQFSFETRSYAHRPGHVQRRYSHEELPHAFLEGNSWEIENEIRELQTKTRILEQEIAEQLRKFYKQGFEAGTSAEIQYVENLLSQKDRDLAILQEKVKQAKGEVAQQRQKRTRALRSLEGRVESAGNCYTELQPLLADTQARINASLAEHAFQQKDYESAIAYFFKAITASPQQERYYSALLAKAFIAAGRQEMPPSAEFLDTSFKQLFTLSKALSSENPLRAPSNVMKKSLSAIYYEFTKLFAKQKDLQKASFALKRSLQIARLAENNDKNIRTLLEKQKILDRQIVAMRK
ncbi:MAG: hypothetical protein GY794_26260 [bacterium]|nr:hypothetical protein [bacterium]